jgi:hypothetical protein
VVKPADPLVGQFFHTFKDVNGYQVVDWQGEVIAKVAEGIYQVRTFCWHDRLGNLYIEPGAPNWATTSRVGGVSAAVTASIWHGAAPISLASRVHRLPGN